MAPKKPKILFYDILTGDYALRAVIESNIYGGGTYSETMRKAFGLESEAWVTVNASMDSNPSLTGIDAVVIGGSTEDPVEGHEKPWMYETYKFIRILVAKNVPLLGICGGLQFTVRALGGTVIYNPQGREFGSVEVQLTSEGKSDPLFVGLEQNIIVQESHKCMAQELNPEWRLLASNATCVVQALAIGSHVRLVQFHPEMDKESLKKLALMRKDGLFKERFAKDEASFELFLESLQDSHATNKAIIKNFMKHFITRT